MRSPSAAMTTLSTLMQALGNVGYYYSLTFEVSECSSLNFALNSQVFTVQLLLERPLWSSHIMRYNSLNKSQRNITRNQAFKVKTIFL